jgi:glucose/arabinose dehydrogenase
VTFTNAKIMTRQISYIIFTSTYKISNAISAEGLVLSKAFFEKGFGAITDIEVGPDGYLYVVSIGLGEIFRIVPSIA